MVTGKQYLVNREGQCRSGLGRRGKSGINQAKRRHVFLFWFRLCTYGHSGCATVHIILRNDSSLFRRRLLLSQGGEEGRHRVEQVADYREDAGPRLPLV